MSNPRIIAGKARGFKLQSVPGTITRPITDRVKEALFNILGADLEDASFLDLFGGTGSVGIEALSRGAGFVRFLDVHREAINTIKNNLAKTHLEGHAEVLHQDAFAFLKQPADRKFQYIFIAPPQYKELWLKALQSLDDNPTWISEDAWVIVQIDPVEYQEQEYQHFREFDRRRYGSTLLLFYEPKSIQC
ncbi:MAG: 16S rRNA (guanine(966)-N(2))-methyltransferase RsmD [Anaerolineaceae bacterium]|nr:16S rRNA (guanine(966)-N(2))-methyltransferase RsmD [Anaerolineaceae bacterium]